jgi:organic hydroperoxide reductase OsmC/OhrA
MTAFPHHYTVSASAADHGDVAVRSHDQPSLRSDSPPQFGGRGDRWSPETLLTAAVADCFVLTFRAIARASNLPWVSLRCDARGTLDRVDRVTRFTHFDLTVHLDVPDGVDHEHVRRLLNAADHTCLVARSLNATSHLDAQIATVRPAMSGVG